MSNSDTTELARWEQLSFLSKVTNTAPNIIYIFNRETQSNEYANRSLGESLGYTAHEIQAMGDAFLPTLMHPDDLPKVGPHFELLASMSDGEVAQLEFRIQHKERKWVWILAYESVFQRNEAGDVIRHIGVATDITLQKQAQEAAIEERRAADAASEDLRAFTYAMSHDLKAPSNTLNLLLTELKTDHWSELNDDARELINHSMTTSNRMQALVDKMIVFTRIVDKTQPHEPVDLYVLAHEIIESSSDEIKACAADITVEQLPVVHGNKHQLGILFQHLISNAIRYRKTDTVPVVSIKGASSTSGDHASFIVVDNGIGVAPEHHQRVFDIFKRLHTFNEYPGTGLGLAISKRIVQAHGGSIAMESQIGKGTTIRVSLQCEPMS